MKDQLKAHRMGGFVLITLLLWLILVGHPALPWQQKPKPSALQNQLQQLLNTPTVLTDHEPTAKRLTIDPSIENIIKNNLEKTMLQTGSKWSTGILMNANTGSILALTSLQNPNSAICTANDSCSAAMQDSAVEPWEPGSIMKPLLIAAALNEGTVQQNSSYFDTGYTYVNGRLFANAEYFPSGNMTMQDILSKSLNTGAIHVLRSMGNGGINKTSRQLWYNYLTQQYRFNIPTHTGLYNESTGHVRRPTGGQNLETQYAGSAFGVGVTTTPLQMVAAYAAIVNGGTYYQPYIGATQKPKVLKANVVSEQVSKTMVAMLHTTLVVNEPSALRDGYIVGAKTGTAPVTGSDAAYKVSRDDGTYVGYIGKQQPEYIMLIRLDEPDTQGFASTVAKQVWSNISNQLISQGFIK